MVDPDGESPAEAAVTDLARCLERGFAALEPWLVVEEPLWSTRPRPDAWSVREVLEHVALMQRYVLLLVDKLGRRSLRELDASPEAAEAKAPEGTADAKVAADNAPADASAPASDESETP